MRTCSEQNMILYHFGKHLRWATNFSLILTSSCVTKWVFEIPDCVFTPQLSVNVLVFFSKPHNCNEITNNAWLFLLLHPWTHPRMLTIWNMLANRSNFSIDATRKLCPMTWLRIKTINNFLISLYPMITCVLSPDFLLIPHYINNGCKNHLSLQIDKNKDILAFCMEGKF